MADARLALMAMMKSMSEEQRLSYIKETIVDIPDDFTLEGVSLKEQFQLMSGHTPLRIKNNIMGQDQAVNM